MLEGNLATARARLEEGLGMYRELDDRFWIAACLLYTGYVDCKEGDHAAAHSRFARLDETLPLLQFPWSIPYLLEGFAWVAAAQGHPKRALGMGGGGGRAAANRRRIVRTRLAGRFAAGIGAGLAVAGRGSG